MSETRYTITMTCNGHQAIKTENVPAQAVELFLPRIIEHRFSSVSILIEVCDHHLYEFRSEYEGLAALES